MAWTYLAAKGDSLRPWDGSASDLSPTVKKINSRGRFYCLGSSAETFRLGRSGTTFALSELGCFPESTRSRQDSPARTSALRALASAWAESEAGFFSKLSALPKNARRHLCSPKMFGRALGSTFPPSELNLRHLGFDAETGTLQLVTLAPRTSGSDGSWLLPTPTTSRGGYNVGGGAGRIGRVRPSLDMMAKQGLWPTPRASANENRQRRPSPSPSQLAGRHGMNLSTAVNLYPTPRASDATHSGPNQTDGLRAAIAKESFPTARDWRSGKASQATHDRNSRPLNETIGGHLNPQWVAWLMGLPTDWLALSTSVNFTPWVMASYRSKVKKRSKGSQGLGEVH